MACNSYWWCIIPGKNTETGKILPLNDFYRFEDVMKDVKCLGAYQGDGGKIVKFGNRETNPNIYLCWCYSGSL